MKMPDAENHNADPVSTMAIHHPILAFIPAFLSRVPCHRLFYAPYFAIDTSHPLARHVPRDIRPVAVFAPGLLELQPVSLAQASRLPRIRQVATQTGRDHIAANARQD